MIDLLLGTSSDWILTIARLVLGIVFFAHGAQKMLGWNGGSGFNPTLQVFTKQLRIPAPLAVLVRSAELFGGLGLAVGLLSRFAALGVVLTMIAAGALFHGVYVW